MSEENTKASKQRDELVMERFQSGKTVPMRLLKNAMKRQGVDALESDEVRVEVK